MSIEEEPKIRTRGQSKSVLHKCELHGNCGHASRLKVSLDCERLKNSRLVAKLNKFEQFLEFYDLQLSWDVWLESQKVAVGQDQKAENSAGRNSNENLS